MHSQKRLKFALRSPIVHSKGKRWSALHRVIVWSIALHFGSVTLWYKLTLTVEIANLFAFLCAAVVAGSKQFNGFVSLRRLHTCRMNVFFPRSTRKCSLSSMATVTAIFIIIASRHLNWVLTLLTTVDVGWIGRMQFLVDFSTAVVWVSFMMCVDANSHAMLASVARLTHLMPLAVDDPSSASPLDDVDLVILLCDRSIKPGYRQEWSAHSKWLIMWMRKT